MGKWKVICHKVYAGNAETKWDFSIEFEQSILWFYWNIFQRENLYFDKKSWRNYKLW